MKYIIIFYTVNPRPPELFYENEMTKLLERIVELARNKSKFVVNRVGECIGDFS